MHEPKKMLMIRNDWIRLGKFLKGKLKQPVDRYPNPDYRVADADEMLAEHLDGMNVYEPLALDTEITRFHEPFCLTYSNCPGMGRLIRASDTDSLEIFQKIIDMWRGPVLWHNYLGVDEKACRDMGLRMPWERIRDTMVLAYHLGNLPQGLKALAYRLLGMKMQDFSDLVTPYSVPKCLEYLSNALWQDWPKPDEQVIRDAGGQWNLYKPQGMSSKIKRFLTDYAKNPNKDVFGAWGNWEDSHAQIEAVCGPWPGRDIQYVPFDKVLGYACRDSDALLRLWPILQSMKRQVRRSLQENWGEA
jgi:hypothetical protein